ncbi:MAG: hypothetical protein NZO16_08145, partial [Deltaproteobacteria bacterium]|nr:hypothetical protein [Deltaproteobacteria bacterium]
MLQALIFVISTLVFGIGLTFYHSLKFSVTNYLTRSNIENFYAFKLRETCVNNFSLELKDARL